MNHWRLVHQEDRILEDGEDPVNDPDFSERKSKNLLHADRSGGGQWFVQIVSDAKCNRTFANFVKGFLRNSHTQLENAFVEKVKESSTAETNGAPQRPTAGARRPTLGRRRSTGF